MFKHFLLPTDGSPSSEVAIRQSVQFAKSINAKVTGFHMIPLYHVFPLQTEMLVNSDENFARYVAQYGIDHAEKLLAAVERSANEAGVECDTVFVTGDYPYKEIIKVANEQGCDLITMASHGHSGMQARLLGSESQKVLTHSTIPVLVYR